MRACTGDGRSPSGQWDGTAPQCPRMLLYLFYKAWRDNVHTQLWTVGLLCPLPMDLMGYQQPQYSQGQ